VTGMLIAPGHPEALATALCLLADDPALTRRLGEAGQHDVAERFPIERMLTRLQDLYDRLAAARI